MLLFLQSKMINLGENLERIVNENKASVSYRPEIRKEVRKEINHNFGSLNSFKSRLRHDVISTPDDPNFKNIYELYSRSLDLKTETKQKLIGGLLFNSSPEFKEGYGPMEENWMVLFHPFKDKIIGASHINMNLFNDMESRSVGTLQELHTMVAPEYGNLGLDSLIFKKNVDYLKKFLEDSKQEALMGNTYMHLFNEQKNPLMITAEEYILDAKTVGIDLCDRLLMQQMENFGELDFNYLRPGIDPVTRPSRSFILNMRTNQKYVSPSLVIGHLKRFMHFSVLNGNDPMEDSSFMEMKNELESEHMEGGIAVLRPDYRKLKDAIYSLDVDTGELNMSISHLMFDRGIELRPYK